MEYKYNAFISYRHAPLDSEMARLIQRKLERYHIPSSVKKETGKTISRVFLDKEELPTSSNLSDDILDALEHSEYLIVICSTNTGESIWVRREIQAFLDRHKRSKIITVLANGEPGEVIPELLLFEERQETDANGRVRTRTVPVEPLSCDFRMERRRALREELPRLVASLLGVEYDQLRQRRKVYQMQRVATASLIALAVMTVFAVYAWKQSSRIAAQAEELREEYRQTLINESLYFASESQAALKENDYHTAIEYGIRALPRDLEAEPVIPQAKHALVDALGVYRTPATAKDMVFPTAIANTGKSELDNIHGMLLTGDGAWLIGWNGAKLCVWSADTMELKGTITPPPESESLSGTVRFCSEQTVFSQKTELIYGTGTGATRVDFLNGKEIWSAHLGAEVRAACLSEDEKLLAACTENELVVLDAENGKQLYTVALGPGEYYSFSYRLALSRDGRYAAIARAESDGEDVNQLRSELWLVDLKEKSASNLANNLYNLEQLQFTRDGQLLAASFRGYHFNYTQNNTKTFSPNQCAALLQSYDTRKGNVRWEKEYAYSHVLRGAWIEEVRVPEEEKDSLFFAFSNYCVILDGADGSMRNTFELRDSIVGLQLFPKGFQVYTETGAMYYSRFLYDTCGSVPYFNGGAGKVISNEPYYYVLEESGIMVRYQLEKADERYESHPVEEGKDLNFHDSAESASWFAAMEGGFSLDDAAVIVLKKEGVQCRSVELPKTENSFYSVLGFSEDERELYVWEKNYTVGDNLHCISVESGTDKTFPFPDVPNDIARRGKRYDDIVCCGGRLILAAELETTVNQRDLSTQVCNRVGVYTWSPGEEPALLSEYELYPTDAVALTEANGYVYPEIPEAEEYSYCKESLKVDAAGQAVLFLLSDRSNQGVRVVRVEPESGRTSSVELHRSADAGDAALENKLTVWSASGKLCAAAWSDEVLLCTASGAGERSIPLSDWEENGVVGLFFTPSEQQLLLLRKDGTLAEYDVQTGEQVGEVMMEDRFSSGTIRMDSFSVEGADCVMLQTDRGISVLDTNPDTLGECWWMEDAICYWEKQDSFLFWRNPVNLGGESETVDAGIIRRYTVADLKEAAEQWLGMDDSGAGKDAS